MKNKKKNWARGPNIKIETQKINRIKFNKYAIFYIIIVIIITSLL